MSAQVLLGSIWVCTITECDLDEFGYMEADPLTVRVVDVLAFPATGVHYTKAARKFASDNTYVDAGRKVLRACDVRMVEVRR